MCSGLFKSLKSKKKKKKKSGLSAKALCSAIA
jgi:hypothetical protein